MGLFYNCQEIVASIGLVRIVDRGLIIDQVEAVAHIFTFLPNVVFVTVFSKCLHFSVKEIGHCFPGF
jgi:hypothetical protein